MMKIKVYHGATEIIEQPLSSVGRDNLDFGKGFYITDIRSQAIVWAKRVADNRLKPPILNVYSMNREEIISTSRCLIFEEYDECWLDFIVGNRTGKALWTAYDYIEGGVANDRVIDTINLYMADLMSREKALERLSEHRPNNQMCIVSQFVINHFLEFYGTEEI